MILLFRRLICLVFGHQLVFERALSGQSLLVRCHRCNRQYAYKSSGDFAGALIPYDEKTRSFFEQLSKTFPREDT